MFGKLICMIVALNVNGCAEPNYAESAMDPEVQESAFCDLEFIQSQLCANFIWEKRPSETEMGSFVLEFRGRGESDRFVELVDTLAVTLWMPSMGHGSRPVVVEKLGMGQYRVTQVFFVMHGDWDIQVQLKRGSQVIEQVVHSVRY